MKTICRAIVIGLFISGSCFLPCKAADSKSPIVRLYISRTSVTPDEGTLVVLEISNPTDAAVTLSSSPDFEVRSNREPQPGTTHLLIFAKVM